MYSLVNLQAHCTIKGFAAGVTEVGLVESLGTLSQFGGNPSYAMHSNCWQDVTKCRQVGLSMVAILLTFSSLTVTLSHTFISTDFQVVPGLGPSHVLKRLQKVFFCWCGLNSPV